MIKLVPALLLICSICYSDDVYLKTGFVFRNVQIIGTSNAAVNILRDGHRFTLDTLDILKVDHRKYLPDQRSSYEMFSQSLYEEYLKSLPAREQLAQQRRQEALVTRIAFERDSTHNANARLDSLYPWRNSLYLAAGFGTPLKYRYELGYHFDVNVTISLTIAVSDDNFYHTVYLGAAATFAFPIDPSRFVPYLTLGYGGGSDLFGTSTYDCALVSYGVVTPIARCLQLRPELGVAYGSYRSPAHQNWFGVYFPESKDDRVRFYALVSLELDFRQLF